jgi:hypothetical protein
MDIDWIRVEDISSASNLAAGKPAVQSSVAASGSPARAVDGVTNGVYGRGSCTHTKREANPWWRVDLGSSSRIGAVDIFNRADCCGSRLSDFQIRIGDTDAPGVNPLCVDPTHPMSSDKTKFYPAATKAFPQGGRQFFNCDMIG